MIAALYVETDGCYFGVPGVDPWDEARDARLYAGPHPVIAHPPCQRWGKLWAGQPLHIKRTGERKVKGDDGGCFAAALYAVREWGGILEHPWGSHAWAHFGLNRPSREGGWIAADFFDGWTCCIEQGRYGHYARKADIAARVPRRFAGIGLGHWRAAAGPGHHRADGAEARQATRRSWRPRWRQEQRTADWYTRAIPRSAHQHCCNRATAEARSMILISVIIATAILIILDAIVQEMRHD